MPRPGWVASATSIAIVLVALAAVYTYGLGGYGLWEPWEADRLQEAIDEEADLESLPEIPSEGAWARGPLVEHVNRAGLADGADEARVRLPAALVALGTLVVAFFVAAILFGPRAALYGTIVLGTVPLFLATGRLLAWSAVPFAGQIMVAGGAAIACVAPFRPAVSTAAGLGLALVGGILGWASVGPMMGVAVPFVGAGLGSLFARPWQVSGSAKWSVVALVVAAVAASAWAVVPFFDAAYLETAAATTPATFELYLRQILLGCYPWSGLLVVGLAVLLRPAIGDREDRAVAVLATSLGVTFLAQTLWSRYAGEAPFLALWPMTAAAGLALARAETGRPARLAALIFLMFLTLGLRDHILEPAVALVPLADGDASLPEGVEGRLFFVVGAALVGLPLILALAQGGGQLASGGYRDWARRWIGWVFPRGGRKIRWLGPAVPALLLANSIVTLAAPSALWVPAMSCVERRIVILVGLMVPAGIAIALGVKVFWDLTGRLGPWRARAAAAGGLALALVGSQSALPALSRHLSSRGLGRAFEEMAEPSARLISYRASTRALELLGATEVEEARSLDELADALASDPEAFAIIRAEDLARADIRYRRRAKKHVPVVYDRSAKLLLLAGTLGAGQKNLSPLEAIVPLERPSPSQPVMANFDDKIELIGIDVEGPSGRDTLCPLDSFTVRYYWHALRSVPGSYKIFVHVDGFGLRINGDHDPAEGRYVVRDWQEGDFILDEQRLKVPGHFRPGDYTIHVGFFQGSRRLTVRDGPRTSDDRVKAGIIRVR